jgi:hypothetical protein
MRPLVSDPMSPRLMLEDPPQSDTPYPPHIHTPDDMKGKVLTVHIRIHSSDKIWPKKGD